MKDQVTVVFYLDKRWECALGMPQRFYDSRDNLRQFYKMEDGRIRIEVTAPKDVIMEYIFNLGSTRNFKISFNE